MKVILKFSIFFSSITGIDDIKIEIPEQTSVGEAVDLFLKSNSNYRSILEKKNLFYNNELRAVYLINRKFVKQNYILQDGDELKILKTFVGG